MLGDHTNRYWDAIREYVTPPRGVRSGGPVIDDRPTVGAPDAYRASDWSLAAARPPMEAPYRHDLVPRYSWTITSPEALAFVAEHSRGRLVDPMAGTGWWAYLLSELADVDTVRYDVDPGTNEYHGGRPLSLSE